MMAGISGSSGLGCSPSLLLGSWPGKADKASPGQHLFISRCTVALNNHRTKRGQLRRLGLVGLSMGVQLHQLHFTEKTKFEFY